jgi:maltooligosyltrehalose trehalohydrolase
MRLIPRRVADRLDLLDQNMHPQNQEIAHAESRLRIRSQGAEVVKGGVSYRTWCKHTEVEALILDEEGEIIRRVALKAEGDGYFSGTDEAGAPGDLYQYRFGDSQPWPDPASCYQPRGVHGPSMVIDPAAFQWKDKRWLAPAYSDLVIYELHVGAFTAAGTFRSAMERLPHLAALGITAIELMPIADFPGERNWGYDGVMLYAPARSYGSPDDLRALADAAHAHGIALILDLVYNHLGPDGNYLGVFHDGYYSHPRRETPWGAALDYSAAPVRALFVENALYWRREFHVDGFRLDATHTIIDPSPRHILAEIADAIQASGGFIIAEDERNEPAVLKPRELGGWGFDGVWADDFHHVVRVQMTNEREGYYANFQGNSTELAETLAHGWLFRGQIESATGEPRGGDPAGLGAPQFIYCISNHDQVGNRAFGERLSHVTSAATYRAASALLCLVPQTPMLFMGQEWGTSAPFQFFTDHNTELGNAITEGRRREFRSFSAFRDPKLLETIPDPQAPQTFLNSKLRWEEMHEPKHAGLLLLYWEFLELRRTHPVFRGSDRENRAVLDLGEGMVAILYGRPGQFRLAVIVDLVGKHTMPSMDDERLAPGGGRDWVALLSSNEARFGGDGEAPFNSPTTMVFESK